MAKYIVESKYFKDGLYLYTAKAKNGVEFVHVRFTNIKAGEHEITGYYERDIPMCNVIRIRRVKGKFEKWIIKRFRKIFRITTKKPKRKSA